jgi:hypothetical protein
VGGLNRAETWRAVDAHGRDPASGRLPSYPGAPSAAAALAAIPVATWPVTAVSSGGRTCTVAAVLGPGGGRVADLLDRLARRPPRPARLATEELLRRTPGGTVDLSPLVVGLADAVGAADEVDPAWMAVVEARRSAPRETLVDRGRGVELEAALNLAMLIGTEQVGDDDGAHVEARIASGARLWLLGGAVAWALAGGDDPFGPWAELVSFGFWPVGPVDGRLVLCDAVG